MPILQAPQNGPLGANPAPGPAPGGATIQLPPVASTILQGLGRLFVPQLPGVQQNSNNPTDVVKTILRVGEWVENIVERAAEENRERSQREAVDAQKAKEEKQRKEAEQAKKELEAERQKREQAEVLARRNEEERQVAVNERDRALGRRPSPLVLPPITPRVTSV